jgi:hypothetical protein
MTRQEIEHMWKVASNDPHHDYNWNDAVVIAFANLVAQHVLEEYRGDFRRVTQAEVNAAIKAEREACADIAENWNSNGFPRTGVANEIRARGQA